MWKIKKPSKIKAKLLFLSIIPIASIAFVSSCSTIFIRKRDTSETKPIAKEDKRVKARIKSFQFSFRLIRGRNDFGLIKNAQDAERLFDRIISEPPRFRNNIRNNFRTSKQRFIEFFKSKYNDEFFRNNDLIFWHSTSGVTPGKTIVDNVTLNNNTLTVNAMYLSRLRREFHDIRVASTAIDKWFHLISVSKKNKFNRIEINKIDTLRKFKNFKSRDYKDNYNENNSRIENRGFNTYE